MEVFTKGNQKGNYGYGVNSWGQHNGMPLMRLRRLLYMNIVMGNKPDCHVY